MTPPVTDHAVLRWIERAGGVDVEALRDWLSRECAPFVAAKATGAKIGEVYAVFKDGKVITILPRAPGTEAIRRHAPAVAPLPPREKQHWQNRKRKRLWR